MVGTVEGVTRAELANEGETTGAAIVTVSVDDELKTSEGQQHQIDILLHWPKELNLEAFDRDLPPGSTVAFYGYDEFSDKVIGRSPDDPTLVVPDPQGFIIEVPDGSLENVWGEMEGASPEWERINSLDALYQEMGIAR